MLNEKVEGLVGQADLLTRAHGPIEVTETQRAQVAIFSNGIVLFANNYRWNPECKALIRSAQSLLYSVDVEYHEVSTATLEALYLDAKAKSGSAPVQTDLPQLERQRVLADMIRKAAEEGASDIVIRVLRGKAEIRTRVFGRMKDFETQDPDEGMAIINAALAASSDRNDSTSTYTNQQGALTPKSKLLPPRVEMLRLQYSATSEGRGALVMRLKYASPANQIEIDHLGYNRAHISDISVMRRRTNGLYIFAGKVSSGKSTTLQRVLNKIFIEKKREISMYAIEEPIELELPGAIQVAAKKGQDGVDGFIEAMKASLRSDPNIIVLGEIRSRELANLAIEAVMTGHALWSTVHAGSALQILDRLLDQGVDLWKLADPKNIRGLVYQRLAGVMCKHCRITVREGHARKEISGDLGNRLAKLLRKDVDQLYIRGPGCDHCRLGLSGRTVCAETVLTDAKLLEHFASGDRAAMTKHWLTPMDKGGLGGAPVLHHALAKVGAGICDINEVEEEVDLLSTYEREFMHLQPRLLQDIKVLEAAEKKG